MRRSLAWILVPSLVACGCASSRNFAGEYRSARKAIDRAEDAGADDRSHELIEVARQSLDDARKAEDDAERDRKDAKERLDAARARFETADGLVRVRKEQLADLESRRRLTADDVRRLEDRMARSGDRGFSEQDTQAAFGARIALARTKLASLEAAVATVEEQVRLRELERKDAELDQRASEARLETAQQRLNVAQALYQRAAASARAAETESLDARRLETRARMNEL